MHLRWTEWRGWFAAASLLYCVMALVLIVLDKMLPSPVSHARRKAEQHNDGSVEVSVAHDQALSPRCRVILLPIAAVVGALTYM